MPVFILTLLMALLLGSPAAAADFAPQAPRTGLGDHLVIAAGSRLQQLILPRGPADSEVPLSNPIYALSYRPDRQLIAVYRPIIDPPPIPSPTNLVAVDDGGNLSFIGEIVLDDFEQPLDLAMDRQGRLFLLTLSSGSFEPVNRLLELDPDSGEVLSAKELPGVADHGALAPGPNGLWVLGRRGLLRLDPETGRVTGPAYGASVLGAISVFAADTDTTGAVWAVGSNPITSPPSVLLVRIDPATGATTSPGLELPANTSALAVRQLCFESPTERCLQGGRFLVQVAWQDFAGKVGDGRVAASRSADSAIFWFFNAANWEMLVKVLDGCDNNGHYWVFAAATTNVGYTLRVTDLEADWTAVYDNPLGQTATAVTHTHAFPCSP